MTPLHAASCKGHIEIVRDLLAHGAAVDVSNVWGASPLYVASSYGRVEAVRVLLDLGADVNVASRDGKTALHAASQGGHVGVVHELLHRSASVDALTLNRETPLWLASAQGHLDVARALLRFGAAVDPPNGAGETPLWIASQSGALAVTCELLRAGASCDSLPPFRKGLHPGVAAVLVEVALWSGDAPICPTADRFPSKAARRSERVAFRQACVSARRLRDLLRPWVDPRAQELRARRFGESRLRLLPWHVRIGVLSSLLVLPRETVLA